MRHEFARELQAELEARGTAEVASDGSPLQVTQALDETEDSVDFLIFGQRKKQGVKPIQDVCSACGFWKASFESVEKCQEYQARDARARGFKKLICPEQLQETKS